MTHNITIPASEKRGCYARVQFSFEDEFIHDLSTFAKIMKIVDKAEEKSSSNIATLRTTDLKKKKKNKEIYESSQPPNPIRLLLINVRISFSLHGLVTLLFLRCLSCLLS